MNISFRLNPISRRISLEYFVLLLIVAVSTFYVYVARANSPLYIDEIAYARAGYSLAQGHLSSISSFFSIYQRLGLVRNDIHTPFGYLDSVEPWLDHPPLVPLLLVPLLVIDSSPKLLSIIFSAASTLLIFALLRERRVLAWSSALAWTGLFVTHPILSMLFVDSGVAFFNLLSLTMLGEYSRTHRRKWLYFAAIASGASALSKEIFGLSSILYLVAYLIYARLGPRHEALTRNLKPILLAVGLASTWWIFAITVDAPLFIQLLHYNVSRSALSDHTFSDVFSILLASFSYSRSSMNYNGVDPILAISWVALIYSLSKSGVRFVQASSVCYLSVVFVLRYAWFFTVIPLFPFFAIGIGDLVTDAISVLRGIFSRATISRFAATRLTRSLASFQRVPRKMG